MGGRQYFAVHAAQRTQSGTVQAINQIAAEIQKRYNALPEDWYLIVLLDFVLPAAVALLLCGVGLYILRSIFRTIFPPSAESLHQEALQKLQMGKEKQCEILLRQAIARSHSTYSPAVLSLAALYVYRRDNAKKSIEVLDSANEATIRTKDTEPAEFKAVRRDAEAILSGNKNMVLVPVAESEFLSALTAVARNKK